VSGARPIIRISPTQSASRCLKTARVRIVRPMKKTLQRRRIDRIAGRCIRRTYRAGPARPTRRCRGPGGGPPGGFVLVLPPYYTKSTPYASVTAVALGLTLGARSSI
jgi:hypothetical protein